MAIKNRLILFGWSLLALFRVPRGKIAANAAANREALRKGGFWVPGEYIENQAQWNEVRLGTKYDMAYGGCGVIAVYNMLVALRLPAGVEDMELLMERFQRKGAALGWKYGLSPRAILRFLRQKGFVVSATNATDDAAVDGMGGRGDAFLVTACNSRKLRDMIHTVCITRDGQGGYLIHNGYHLEEQPDGGESYCAHGPFLTLSDAVRHISAHGAVPVSVLGVSRM